LPFAGPPHLPALLLLIMNPPHHWTSHAGLGPRDPLLQPSC